MSNTAILEKIKIKEPKKWVVIAINDDTTPFDFVIHMLQTIFNHEEEFAIELANSIHDDGSAVIGIYDFEIAEIKAIESTKMARDEGFPLQFRIEQD